MCYARLRAHPSNGSQAALNFGDPERNETKWKRKGNNVVVNLVGSGDRVTEEDVQCSQFSDGTLTHVRTALNDIAIGIQMEYLPKRRWTKQDKRRARVMINAIDKKIRDRRLMRSLEKFVGGRPYEGDMRLLERTI
ncbi:hypothetical protein Tco_0183450 [Tanacetum coccineum]